jgi:DoxX-like family
MNVNAASAESGTARVAKRSTLWAGRILTALPILLMLFSASMKFTGNHQMVDEFVNRFGYVATVAPILGVVELTCVVLYAIPRTAVLGAILMTGYLGGAVATHVRIGDPSFVMPFALGVVAWGGLYFREERLHPLLPLRSSAAPR